MGSDDWQADVKKLQDRKAVIDSNFKVHGIRGLRVVDASVFPTIPGYFIVTPVLMISEKAADTILADTQEYPESLRISEDDAIKERRKAALVSDNPHGAIGLPLSGVASAAPHFASGCCKLWRRRTGSG